MPRARTPAILQTPLYLTLRTLAAAAAVAPPRRTIPAARRLGRAFARAPVNRSRLGRAEANLAAAFPGWDGGRVRECALRSYEHLFMLGMEIAYAPRVLTEDGWTGHIELGDISRGVRALIEAGPCVLITGHCGNWELMGYTVALLGFPMHALYRPLDLRPLDQWVRRTRERRGLTLVDKFGAIRLLPTMVRSGAPLAFVADQNGGDRGVFVPFFNRLASTYKSIGLLALQFEATVVCGFARRAGDAPRGGLGYRVDLADVIRPREWQAHPDPLFYLTARYRRAIEGMVLAAPEQYLWMHRIWRSRPRHERLNRPFPTQLLEKLRTLPWLTEEDLARIVEHSERDARTLAASGLDRLP